MLKKAVIVYLLLLAYTCVLVHNLIPHHHHKYSSIKHHHHHEEHHVEDHHDNDEDEHDEDASDHVFAYHQHSSSDAQIEHTLSFPENNELKSKLNSLPLSFFYFHFKPPKIPDDPLWSGYNIPIILSFHPSSCSLKAPPSFRS